MATALETSPAAESASPTTGSPLSAGIAGAAILLVGFAIVSYAVPFVWDTALTPVFTKLGGFLNAFLRVAALLAAAVGVVWAASKLLPSNPPLGTRGAIFLIISAFVTLFFLLYALSANLDTRATGGMITFTVLATALVFGFVILLRSARFSDWCVKLEEQGLFHTHTFKKTQGLRTRRWTMLAILFLGLSGVWAMVSGNVLPVGDWMVPLPFLADADGKPKLVRLLSDVNYTLPLVLTAATVWFAWRAVHMPTFGDFLIGTDAEMNKVSWSTWKKLAQDTVVVLVTTALLTAFLLVIDLFWGWLLSDVVRVLPKHAPTKTDTQGQSAW
jgi:preprotein translocase SecE subunit